MGATKYRSFFVDRKCIDNSKYIKFHNTGHWIISVHTDKHHFYCLWNFNVEVLFYTRNRMLTNIIKQSLNVSVFVKTKIEFETIPYGLSNIFDFDFKHICIHFKYHANKIKYYSLNIIEKKPTYSCTKKLYFYSLFLL